MASVKAPSGPLSWACGSLLCLLLLTWCLRFPGAHGQASPLRVEPQYPVLPSGGSISVNCSADCPDAENIVMETFLSKELLGRGPNWLAFRLSNVTDNANVICAAYCNGSQISSSTDITVYRLPERVELAPLPPWQPVGENLTLSCQVVGGAPRAHLTVVLLRGEEELSRQPAEGDPAEVTSTVPARREDHGANYSCRTELDLRGQGLELFETNSTSKQLRTFVLPMAGPFLSAPRTLEVGRESAVTCWLAGLFPVREAQVHMALGDQQLNPVVVRHGDMLSATATVTARKEQDAQIVCNVTLGGESRKTEETVIIYSFVEPILHLSNARALEGTTVTVVCMAGARVRVYMDGAPITAPGQHTQLQLIATENDDGRNFSCEASLEVGGQTLQKKISIQLHVLYGPIIEHAHCPQRLLWKEKSSQVLRCQARGNPVPKLQCLHKVSGSPVPVGIPFTVTLQHNGTYHCQAVSSLGSTTLDVVMEVQNRNAYYVTIILTVLVILGLVAVAVASLHVFGVKMRSGTYRVEQGSTSLPLTSIQPERQSGEEPS
ncbi:intercellular adhesion molecule 3 [Rhynchocyon petersi]